jgi:hypothetical protein
MVRFGVTNIYLAVGLVLIALGLLLGMWLFFGSPAIEHRGLLLQIASGSFFGGVVLYVIGRATQVLQRRSSR